jgi:hypothetical protein
MLLHEIRDGAVDSMTDITTVLRKCLVLAVKLGHEDFRKWVEQELERIPRREGESAALPGTARAWSGWDGEGGPGLAGEGRGVWGRAAGRNVASTYFSEARQRKTLRKIEERLLSRGVLVIGSTESLPTATIGFGRPAALSLLGRLRRSAPPQRALRGTASCLRHDDLQVNSAADLRGQSFLVVGNRGTRPAGPLAG